LTQPTHAQPQVYKYGSSVTHLGSITLETAVRFNRLLPIHFVREEGDYHAPAAKRVPSQASEQQQSSSRAAASSRAALCPGSPRLSL